MYTNATFIHGGDYEAETVTILVAMEYMWVYMT